MQEKGTTEVVVVVFKPKTLKKLDKRFLYVEVLFF